MADIGRAGALCAEFAKCAIVVSLCQTPACCVADQVMMMIDWRWQSQKVL